MSSVPLELETTSFSLLEEDILADSEDFADSEDSADTSTGVSIDPAELPSKAVSLELDTRAISEEEEKEEESSQPSQTDNKESSSRGATLM